MRYNSVDHFLKEREVDIVAIIETVQRDVGGHYALLTPEQLHENAVNDTQYVTQIWRQGLADRDAGDIATAADRDGVDLDDLIRLVDGMSAAFTPFFEEELRDQPDLRADLLRRLRHTAASYRSSVLSVKIDKTLRQFPGTKG